MNLSARLALAARALAGNLGGIDPGASGGMLTGLGMSNVPKRGSAEFLKAYSTMPWLRATVHRIAESIASTRWHVFAVRQGGSFRSMPSLTKAAPVERRAMLRKLHQAGELQEIFDLPLLRLLHDGNTILVGGAIRRVTQIHIDIVGEAFWLKERNAAGVPEAVWPLPPTWISQTPTPSSPVYLLNFQNIQQTVPESEVLWFKDPDPVNPYGRGSGVAGALADELEIDEYAAKYTKAWFYNNALPAAIISPADQDKGWDETTARKMQTSWLHQHQGFWRAFKIQFSRIPLKVHELSHTFREQELGKLRERERNTIIQVLGIPPEIVGIIENSNRATIESAETLFAKYVLVPRLELQRETMQIRLIPEYDERLIIDYDNPVPEDKDFQLRVARSQPHALLVNEWRDMAGLEPLPNGNVHVIPANLTIQETLQVAPTNNDVSRSWPPPQDEAEHCQPPSASPRLGDKALDFVDNAPDDDSFLMIHRIADRLIPRVQRQFLAEIQTVKDTVDMTRLEEALRAQISPHVIDNILAWHIFIENLREATSATFLEGMLASGRGSATVLGEELGISIGFNDANPQVAQFATNHAAELVSNITEPSREAIRQAVGRAFIEGRSSQQVAREIRDVIGLLPRDETIVGKFRARLLEEGRGVQEIERRVTQQSRLLLRKRSEVIARTEMIDVANEGQELLWEQAAQEGFIDRTTARRFWNTTDDDRLDVKVCEPIPFLNSAGVSLNQPFVTPVGPRMRPTAHPQCRCTVRLETKKQN